MKRRIHWGDDDIMRAVRAGRVSKGSPEQLLLAMKLAKDPALLATFNAAAAPAVSKARGKVRRG